MHPFSSPNNPISLYPFKVKLREELYTLAVYMSSPPTTQPTTEWFPPHNFTETALIKTTVTCKDLFQYTTFWFILLELSAIFAKVNHSLLEILPSFNFPSAFLVFLNSAGALFLQLFSLFFFFLPPNSWKFPCSLLPLIMFSTPILGDLMRFHEFKCTFRLLTPIIYPGHRYLL